MIDISSILLLLILHWFGDFLFQTQYMALKKSTKNWALLQHVLVYTATVFCGVVFFNIIFEKPASVYLWFGAWTFVTHFIIDYFSSRIMRDLYVNKVFYGFPSFFTILGIDQFLHITQLVICYKYFIQ